MYDDLRYEVAGGIATITIDRPERRNALRPKSLSELAAALGAASDDREVGVVVVTGAGDRAFCAGGDLGTVTGADAGPGSTPPEPALAEMLALVMAFRQCDKPVIAKVRGWCIGLGNEVNLLCDLTIAGESAKFGQAGPRVGSVPIVGGTQMLPLVCGMKRAKEILFMCRTYSGDAAVAMGLANVVVPDAELDAEVERWAAELLAMSPQSLRMAKMSLSALFDLQWPALQHGLELTRWMFSSAEMREGASAFLEKRAPQFRSSGA
jgi:naphthoate synthase/2-ketocyclohexanecarboxyl-CoA hydrolase